MNTQSLEQYYDGLPYDFRPIAVTRPENLQAIARLHGMDVPSLNGARILELGGASGGNLIPVALRFPGSECVVMDLSGRQIRDGQVFLEQCGGLPNISLRQASIADIDGSWGKFDYIVCHGVFSWVPENIRADVLRVCRENLSDNGIALISFNTYPGWKEREAIRDAMLDAARDYESPADKLAKGRELFRDLKAVSEGNPSLKAVVDDMATLIETGTDSYLLHEFFEPENQAFYLKDVVTRAQTAGLAYLGDSAIATMSVENYPAPLQEVVQRRNITDPVEQQQFLDFGVNRTFRHALFVGSQHANAIRLNLDALSAMHFAGQFTQTLDEQGQPIRGRLSDMGGMHYFAENPVFMTIAEVLSRAFPASVPYMQLRNELQSRARVSFAEADDMLKPFIRMMVVKGSIAPLVEPSIAAATVDAKPLIHPLMRAQLRNQIERNPSSPRFTTWSLMHDELWLDPFGAWLASQLDGTRDIEALAGLALQAIADGAAVIPPEVGPVRREMLIAQLPHSLESLRRHGVIIR